MMVNIPIPTFTSYSLDVAQTGQYSQPSYTTYDPSNPTVNINLRSNDHAALAYIQANRYIIDQLIEDFNKRKEEEALRKQYPALQNLHDQYQTMLVLVKDGNGNQQS